MLWIKGVWDDRVLLYVTANFSDKVCRFNEVDNKLMTQSNQGQLLWDRQLICELFVTYCKTGNIEGSTAGLEQGLKEFCVKEKQSKLIYTSGLKST